MSLARFNKISACHNRALIVSVENFSACAGLRRRSGVKWDTKRLHATLSRRGFRVKILVDPVAHEIIQAFKEESEWSVHSCFVGVLSSHGEQGVIFGSDGHPVKLAHIYSLFGGPKMAAKNKLFLIQACRGGALDDGIEIETDSVENEGGDDVWCEYQSIPFQTVVAYATAPGYSAFKNPSGSVFMQTFCDLVEECDQLEITQFLTQLNRRVAFEFEARGNELQGKKEMPCIINRLIYDCYPFTNALQVSAMELLQDTQTNPTASIS